MNVAPPFGNRGSYALLTDLYQLTMGYGYWRNRVHDREAVFHLFFRNHPFRGGYTIACGLHDAVTFIQSLRFDASDIGYLASLTGADGRRLFEPAFLDHLSAFEFACDVDAMPEGTVVFPQEPLLRVRGPILQCQLLETSLLNLLNFQSLIATKASRVCHAARGEPVLEFGLRRAQGIDGALSASRAAYVGGCAATSNVLAGKLFGIPVRGTHAHSWVMSFDTEREAFQKYAEAMPNNCVFLVDTYDTIEGVHHAVEAGRWLRERGHEMIGIRLDSGDLAYLSIEARKILDAAGFPNAVIVASNDLDEHIIASLKQQNAMIGMWGVGTKLATGYDQPALGGVYKLASVKTPDGRWDYKIKVSEQAIKVTTPGILQVRRFHQPTGFIADAMYDETLGIPAACVVIDPMNATRRKVIPVGASFTDLLEPVFRGGNLVGSLPDIHTVRTRARSQLAMLHDGTKRLMNPHEYPVGLESSLHQLKTDLVHKTRGDTP
jgi:nicotinate phosphoribosyltransferase